MLVNEICKMKEEILFLKTENSVLFKRANEASSELFYMKVIELLIINWLKEYLSYVIKYTQLRKQSLVLDLHASVYTILRYNNNYLYQKEKKGKPACLSGHYR